MQASPEPEWPLMTPADRSHPDHRHLDDAVPAAPLGADASPEQVQSFVTGFFEALEVASAQTIVPVDQTPNLQSNLEPARAA